MFVLQYILDTLILTVNKNVLTEVLHIQEII